jgi:hypothetical protein
MVSRIENGGRCSEKCVRSQRICGVLADCCGWRSSWLVALVCRTTHAIAGGEGQKNELLMCASSCLVYAFMLNDRGGQTSERRDRNGEPKVNRARALDAGAEVCANRGGRTASACRSLKVVVEVGDLRGKENNEEKPRGSLNGRAHRAECVGSSSER